MSNGSQAVPDIGRCFGHYRQQSPQYALTMCVRCSKVKACVRTVWGMEQPRRNGRGDWWEGKKHSSARGTKGAKAGARQSGTSLPLAGYLSAT